jgi:hypothetical protein
MIHFFWWVLPTLGKQRPAAQQAKPARRCSSKKRLFFQAMKRYTGIIQRATLQAGALLQGAAQQAQHATLQV